MHKLIVYLAFLSALGLFSCRLTKYKVNYSKVPAIELEWLNPLSDHYRNVIYTGEMPLHFRLRSEQPVRRPHSLKITYQDGYTNRRIVLAEYARKAGEALDTTFTIVTREKIDYYNDNRVRVRALLGSGKYGSAYSEFFRLGVPLLVLVRGGDVSYTDGNGRRFLLGRDVAKLALPDSTYEVPVDRALQNSLIFYFKNMLPDSTRYAEPGCPVISVKQGVRVEEITIKKDSETAGQLHTYLRHLFHL